MPAIPDDEQQRLIHEMMADPHLQRVLRVTNGLVADHPDVVIYYGITCSNCSVNVGDEDKFSLHAAYICEECGHATKTTEGNLGFIYILPADGGGHYSFRCTPPLDQHQTIR